MNVRRAAAEDFDAIAELWREFDHEIPPPTHEGPADEEKELARGARDHRLRDRVRRRGRRRNAGRLRARATARAGIRDAHGSLRRAATRAAAGSGRSSCARCSSAFRELGIEHFDLEVMASNHVARSLYARWGLKDEVVVMTGSVSGARGAARRAGGRRRSARSTPVGRPERGRAGSAAVRPAAPGRLARLARRAAAGRLDRRLRRRLRPQPGDAPPTRARALRQDGCRDLAARRRARGARADDPLRARADRGRVPLGPGVLRPAAARRRRRTRREPDGRRRASRAPIPEAVRRVARTAPSPADLPPARELLAELAGVMRVEGAETGGPMRPSSTDR